MTAQNESLGQTYEEPSIFIILIISSFIVLLNLFEYGFNALISCGLIGQILVGIVFSLPSTNWLPNGFKEATSQLGYLGLILLVYEGGISTHVPSLRSNFFLAVSVASTGIVLPVGLSFMLQLLIDASPLQAFAAGAALCCTSLGTTFVMLQNTGFNKTQLGVLLSTAAILDDVVGLIMVQVITVLGDKGNFNAATVIRPLGVSIAFVILFVVGCRFGSKRMAKWIGKAQDMDESSRIGRFIQGLGFQWLVHTTVLLGLVTAANYAGTSSLLAAYLVGASVSWIDSEVDDSSYKSTAKNPPTTSDIGSGKVGDHLKETPEGGKATGNEISETKAEMQHTRSELPAPRRRTTGAEVFNHFTKPVMETLLKAFFFASIGFAIPLAQLFNGRIIWRGLVYSLLMIVAKLMTGIWLVRVKMPQWRSSVRLHTPVKRLSGAFGWPCFATRKGKRAEKAKNSPSSNTAIEAPSTTGETTASTSTPSNAPRTSQSPSKASPKTVEKPLSLYPASILGLAMVARGEISYLIASTAESRGIFKRGDSQPGGSDIYLVAVWAITLSTLIAPACVGILVKRVKKLQKSAVESRESLDPLGSWGVLQGAS